MTMRDVINEAMERPVYTKLGVGDIPLSSVALNSLVQRDVRESVVISPPSIASGGSVLTRGFDEKPKAPSSGIGVNIHRSKQGVFVVRSVHPGGLAANSKRVRPGDILVSLNDQPVEGKTLVEVHNAIQDSIGKPLKLGLLNTLGKIDVTLDFANENHSDEHVPEAEASKSVISEHIACSPDASLGLKGLSPIPAAGLGDGGSGDNYGRAGGGFDAYDASLLDRLHEFQQKRMQAGESESAGPAQSSAPLKKATSSSDAAVACLSKLGKGISSDAAEANSRHYSSLPKSSCSPSSRTLWSELKQLPLCMDDFQAQSSQTLYHLAELQQPLLPEPAGPPLTDLRSTYHAGEQPGGNTSGRSSVLMQGLDIFSAAPSSGRADDAPLRPHHVPPQPLKPFPGAGPAAGRSKSGGQGGAGAAGESNWFLVKCLPLEMDDYHHGCSQELASLAEGKSPLSPLTKQPILEQAGGGAPNGWTAVSKLPMALDDHSVDEEDELRGIGQRVAVLL